MNWRHFYENVKQKCQLLIEKIFKAFRENAKIIALLGNIMQDVTTQIDQMVKQK